MENERALLLISVVENLFLVVDYWPPATRHLAAARFLVRGSHVVSFFFQVFPFCRSPLRADGLDDKLLEYY
jgi:hypothetical protein